MSPSLPNLKELELGFNRLDTLSPRHDEAPYAGSVRLAKLESVNLESNELSDWEETLEAMSQLPKCASENPLDSLYRVTNRSSTV